MSLSILYLVLRLCVGLTSLWALAEKVRAPSGFVDGVRRYELLPRRLVPVAAATVLVAEFSVSTLLLTGVAEALGATIAVGLFLAFAIAMGVNLVRGRRVPCMCFGVAETERISLTTLLRTVVLLAISWMTLWLAIRQPTRPPAGDVAPAVTVAVGLAVLLRLSGVVPEASRYLRFSPVNVPPTPTSRVSFRHAPLDAPLRSPFQLSARAARPEMTFGSVDGDSPERGSR